MRRKTTTERFMTVLRGWGRAEAPWRAYDHHVGGSMRPAWLREALGVLAGGERAYAVAPVRARRRS